MIVNALFSTVFMVFGFSSYGYHHISIGIFRKFGTASINKPMICHRNFVAFSTESANTVAALTELSRLEIRVGKIIEIGKHPEADNLYVEKVDVGEPEARTIVSGLVEYCPIESLQQSQVIILCNLKPRSIKGIPSFGMLLCSSSSDKTKVEPLRPPEGSANGQLVTFEGHLSEPVEAGNRATKAYTKIAEDFFVDENNRATYKGTPFMTPLGSVTCNLKGKIS